MLVACRLADRSALGAHYAGVKWRAMRGRVWLRGSFLLGVGERGRPLLPSPTPGGTTRSQHERSQSGASGGNS
jgi:hypothetical protein